MTGNPFDPRERQRRFGDPGLTRRILERTSGSACGRAEALLGGRWDTRLDDVDDGLLAEHLQRCARCRALAAVLDRLPPVLSTLAEREPGPSFTAAVIAATSVTTGGTNAAAARRRPTGGPMERLALALQDRLRRLWDRPRFALEAAWTASALASLLVLGPLASDSATAPIGRTVQAGAGAVPELIDRAEQLAATVVASGRGRAQVVILAMQTRVTDARRYLALVRTVVLGEEPVAGDTGPQEPLNNDTERR